VTEESEELRVTAMALIVWQDLTGERVVSKGSAVFWNCGDGLQANRVVKKRMGATLKWPPWSRV